MEITYLLSNLILLTITATVSGIFNLSHYIVSFIHRLIIRALRKIINFKEEKHIINRLFIFIIRFCLSPQNEKWNLNILLNNYLKVHITVSSVFSLSWSILNKSMKKKHRFCEWWQIDFMISLSEISIVHRYERLLRRARSEDLSEVSGIGCLYQSGVDRLGRPVVVFIGKWFPISDIDLDKVSMKHQKLIYSIAY